jgi:hypothetical protein
VIIDLDIIYLKYISTNILILTMESHQLNKKDCYTQIKLLMRHVNRHDDKEIKSALFTNMCAFVYITIDIFRDDEEIIKEIYDFIEIHFCYKRCSGICVDSLIDGLNKINPIFKRMTDNCRGFDYVFSSVSFKNISDHFGVLNHMIDSNTEIGNLSFGLISFFDGQYDFITNTFLRRFILKMYNNICSGGGCRDTITYLLLKVFRKFDEDFQNTTINELNLECYHLFYHRFIMSDILKSNFDNMSNEFLLYKLSGLQEHVDVNIALKNIDMTQKTKIQINGKLAILGNYTRLPLEPVSKNTVEESDDEDCTQESEIWCFIHDELDMFLTTHNRMPGTNNDDEFIYMSMIYDTHEDYKNREGCMSFPKNRKLWRILSNKINKYGILFQYDEEEEEEVEEEEEEEEEEVEEEEEEVEEEEEEEVEEEEEEVEEEEEEEVEEEDVEEEDVEEEEEEDVEEEEVNQINFGATFFSYFRPDW